MKLNLESIIVLMMVSWLILLFVCKLQLVLNVLPTLTVDGVHLKINVSQELELVLVKDTLVPMDMLTII
jgi:hypothetical protein